MKRLLYILMIAALALSPLAARGEESPASAGGGQESAPAEAQEPAAEDAQEPAAEDVQEPAAEDVQETISEDVRPEGLNGDGSPHDFILKPETDTWLGYRFVDFDGSKRAGEFVWPHDSVAGGFKLHYSPLPQRFDAELDWKNVMDYQAEFAYAFKDMVKLNYVGWSLWHNLDHTEPQSPVTVDFDPGPGTQYHVTARDNRAFLRIKWPDEPYHVFVEYRRFEKEGIIQSRWYEAAPANKATKARDIDWIMDRYVAGINGHLGPVELEYSHLLKNFDPHKDVSLTDDFMFVPAAHSVVPELKTNADTVKIHTDLTGRIVAAATFVTGEKKNNNSGSEVDYRRAYGDLTLMPLKDVTIAVKYRYKELQETVPETFGRAVFDFSTFPPAVPGAPGVTTDPINSRLNHAEVAVRYAPLTQLAVKAEYSFDNIKRYNAKEWSDLEIMPFQSIPSVQNIHKVKVGINTRPTRNMDLIGSLEYLYNNDPAYPTKPKSAYKGRVHADWMIIPTVTAGAHYRITAEENNSANMSSKFDNAGGQLLWSPAEKIYFTAAYDYFRNKNVRDIELTLGDIANTPFPEERVPYRDSSHVYALSAGYAFPFPLSLETEFRQSWSKGMFRTRAAVAGATSSGVGELADLRVRETGGSVCARYDFPKGWTASATYSINNYEDLNDIHSGILFDGPQDGTVNIVTIMVSKKWF